MLRASHIKPWKYCNDAERLDLYNGLLLTPNYDALFEKGFISFDDDGKIILSSKLDHNERILYGITSTLLISIEHGHKQYLEFHRTHIFQ